MDDHHYSSRAKRKPAAPDAPSSKRRRQAPPEAAAAVRKPRPKLSTRRPPRKAQEPKEKKQTVTLFSRHADPSVQSPKPKSAPVQAARGKERGRAVEAGASGLSYMSEVSATGATLLETPPRRRRTKANATLTGDIEAEGVVDLTAVEHVGSLEMVEGDGILDTLLRASTPRVKRKFPSEDALTDSEQRDREALRRRRLKLRSQFSAMKAGPDVAVAVKASPRSLEVDRKLFQTEREAVSAAGSGETEERAQLEEEEAETDEETTESKIDRLSKVMHMDWRQFLLWLVSGALLLCAIVVAAPFAKKLLEPPLPYCDSDWIEQSEGSFVLADPADRFDRSKALQPFISTSAMAARASGTACQPCPVYGNCLNGSVISCAPPYALHYGLCKEDPQVQENLDQLALGIQKFVIGKAAKIACDNVSLWTYLTSDDELDVTSGLTASIDVLLSDVQVFVSRTISYGKAVSRLPREYVFNRALDMALRDLKDIFVTEDQRQLVVGGGVVPWSCRAKHQLYAHIKLIALAVALGTALVFGYRQFLVYRTERELVDRFMKEVRFFLLDRTRRPDRFYPADHLRDELFEKRSLQDRAWLCKSVWPKVAAVVKDDSRITTRVMRYVVRCWRNWGLLHANVIIPRCSNATE